MPELAPTLGVLAFGDSITNGGGELQWGVALQSWALWTARALGLPYSPYATDGARAQDVVARQIPDFAQRQRAQDGPYDVGCVYVGVNDVRALDWDPDAYARDLSSALAFLAARCTRVLTCTLPSDLGRPRAGGRVPEANTIVRRVAREHAALVVDLRDFGARNRVMADHVHPTAFGQVAIAQRALRVLAADGLPAWTDPAALIAYDTTRWGRLRADASYAYRHAKVSARAAYLGLRAASMRL